MAVSGRLASVGTSVNVLHFFGGCATAKELARLGARVHLVGRSTERLESAAAAIRTEVPDASLVVRECDISNLDSVATLIAALASERCCPRQRARDSDLQRTGAQVRICFAKCVRNQVGGAKCSW